MNYNLRVYGQYIRNFIEYVQKPQEVIVEEDLVEKAESKPTFLQVQELWHDIKSVIISDLIYFLSLVGPQGKGKTVLSSIFATLAEQDGFEVIYAMPEDFIDNFDEWIAKIKVDKPADKYCFILDDLSYYLETKSKKSQSIVKNIIARIRHEFEVKVDTPEGQKTINKPIFIIYISHRLHAVPPMLRNSGTFIFPSMQSADREDMIKLITKRKSMQERLEKIYRFISRVAILGPRDGGFPYYTHDGEEKYFKWGKEDDPGDGRLMVAFHGGQLKIFQSQMVENMIKLDPEKRIFVNTTTKPKVEEKILTQEEKDQKIREAADALFSTPKNDLPDNKIEDGPKNEP
jgi:hypothetical protein